MFFVCERFFWNFAICWSVISTPPNAASRLEKSMACALVKPTQPCEAKPPSLAGDLPPWINDGKPIGIFTSPRGLSLLPASTFWPILTLLVDDSTQGSSGGVHVGLKMIEFAVRTPTGSGNSG